MAAPKENNSGIIPIFKELSQHYPQLFDTGRKSRSKSNKIKAAAATDAPSGIPGTSSLIEHLKKLNLMKLD